MSLTISLRIDDVNSTTNLSFIEKLDQTLRIMNGKIELSFIPFLNGADPNYNISYLNSILRHDSPITFSLHGYKHIKHYGAPEFKGRSLDEQVNDVSVGLASLKELLTFNYKFVPPWNAYDQNTLKACKILNITQLGTSFKQMFVLDESIEIHPISMDINDFQRCNLSRYLQSKNKYHANIMAHDYDFCEFGNSRTNTKRSLFEFLAALHASSIAVVNYRRTNLDNMFKFKKIVRLRRLVHNRLTPRFFKIGKIYDSHC